MLKYPGMILTLALALTVATSPDVASSPTPPTGLQVTAQVGTSLAGAVAGGLGGAVIGLGISQLSCSELSCALRTIPLTMNVAGAVGAGAGVLLVSSLIGIEGNAGLGMLAALVGATPGVLSTLWVGETNLAAVLGWVLTGVLAPALAVVAYDWRLSEGTQLSLTPTQGGAAIGFTTRW